MKTTEQPKTPQQLFREAAAKIESALVLLDMRETACSTCGSRRFENFAHAKAYRAFTDTPTRLLEAADRLDDKDIYASHSDHVAR